MSFIDWFTEEAVKNDNKRIFLFSELGGGKTTSLKKLTETLVTDYSKYKIIPIYVDCLSIGSKNSVFEYILSKYCPNLADDEISQNREAILKGYLQSPQYKFLLMFDNTDLVGSETYTNVIETLNEINEYSDLYVIFAGSNKKRFEEDVFYDYKFVGLKLLDDSADAVFGDSEIGSDVKEMLRLPFYLKLYKEQNNSKNTEINEYTLLESYFNRILNEGILDKGGGEFKKREKFIKITLPEAVFKSDNAILSFSGGEHTAVSYSNYSFMKCVAKTDNSAKFILTHDIYYYYVLANYMGNILVESEDKDEAEKEFISLLNKKEYPDLVLKLIGQKLKVQVDRSSSAVYKCIDVIRNEIKKEEKIEPASVPAAPKKKPGFFTILYWILLYFFRFGVEPETVEEQEDEIVEEKDCETYAVAVGNILRVFSLACPDEQLSGLDLSRLDLTECNFVGINCTETDFSYSKFNEDKIIPWRCSPNVSLFAVSADGKYCVMSENYKTDYCKIFIIDTENNKLVDRLSIYSVFSIKAIDSERFAVIHKKDRRLSDIVISIFSFSNGELEIKMSIGDISKKYTDFTLLGVYDNLLFYLSYYKYGSVMENMVESVPLKGGTKTKYAALPVDEYENIKTFCNQNNSSNNGILLYTANSKSGKLETFFISFGNIVNSNFKSAVSKSVDLPEDKVEVAFSAEEPVAVFYNDANYVIYNYISAKRDDEYDDPDDYLNSSTVFCVGFKVLLGDCDSAGKTPLEKYEKIKNNEIVFMDDNGYLIAKKNNDLIFYDMNEEFVRKFLVGLEYVTVCLVEDSIYASTLKEIAVNQKDKFPLKLYDFYNYSISLKKISPLKFNLDEVNGYYSFNNNRVFVNFNDASRSDLCDDLIEIFFYLYIYYKNYKDTCQLSSKADYNIVVISLENIVSTASHDLKLLSAFAFTEEESGRYGHDIYITYDGYVINQSEIIGYYDNNVFVNALRIDYTCEGNVIGCFDKHVFIYDYKKGRKVLEFDIEYQCLPIELWFTIEENEYKVYVRNTVYTFDSNGEKISAENIKFYGMEIHKDMIESLLIQWRSDESSEYKYEFIGDYYSSYFAHISSFLREYNKLSPLSNFGIREIASQGIFAYYNNGEQANMFELPICFTNSLIQYLTNNRGHVFYKDKFIFSVDQLHDLYVDGANFNNAKGLRGSNIDLLKLYGASFEDNEQSEMQPE